MRGFELVINQLFSSKVEENVIFWGFFPVSFHLKRNRVFKRESACAVTFLASKISTEVKRFSSLVPLETVNSAEKRNCSIVALKAN